MYGVPLDVDWTFLLGRCVWDLCVGVGTVRLKLMEVRPPASGHGPITLGELATISISCDADKVAFRHTTAKRSTSDVPGAPGQSVTLVSLIGSYVTRVVAEDDHTLLVCFDNDEEVRIFELDDGYECFTVSGGPRGLIVV